MKQPTLNHNLHWLDTSWHRSKQAGLLQHHEGEEWRLDRVQLEERKQQLAHLIDISTRFAVPLFEQHFSRTKSRLILTDHQGVIVSEWGERRFANKFAAIALESGVCWQENLKGTNAIGTALIEKSPITVIGNQHFIDHHHFISCSACPIFDHQHNLIAILDITSEQQIHQSDTPALIQAMVKMIENEWLCSHPQGDTRLEFALSQPILGSGWQGIAVADRHGKIVAHNAMAGQLLDQAPLIGKSLDALIASCQDRFVYQMQNKSNTSTTFTSDPFVPSCPLHYGEPRIEQAWQQTCQLIDQDIAILIEGETGAGKNEFVKQLHQHSKRNQQPLIAVNCSALPKDLLEAELFGYAPGAFTGANPKGYQGKIRAAHQGLLFLDEIADMPLEAQARLLHVLQDKKVIPVGSNHCHDVDIYLITASQENLAELVKQGRFRQDLYFRINGFKATLPPLRERQDKQALIEKIHRQYADKSQCIDQPLMDTLLRYPWPGNLRELDSAIKVASLLSKGLSCLGFDQLVDDFKQRLRDDHSKDLTPCRVDDRQENDDVSAELKATIEQTLLSTYYRLQGNISQTAQALGISRNTVYRKLKKLGIDPSH